MAVRYEVTKTPISSLRRFMDRIVHNAVWREMGDMNMRQAMAGKGR